jgi:hypothetical protein
MKPFTAIAIVLFAVVAIAHVLRLFAGWEVIVNGLEIPVWLSLPASIVAAGLAAMLWREARA